MTNYSQLNISQRETICILLNKGKNFTEIGKSIDKDRTTISKEIKRNRYIKSNFYEPFDIKGINKALDDCNKLKHFPYVCNTCPNKNTRSRVTYIMIIESHKNVMKKSLLFLELVLILILILLKRLNNR